MDNTILNEKQQLLSTDFKPKSSQLFIHPEQGQCCKINDTIKDIEKDLKIIDDSLIEKSNNVKDLLSSTVKRLEQVELKIIKEKERLQDIAMLCNKYTDFDKVINITNKDTTGSYSYVNDTFLAKINSYQSNQIAIDDINGNGLEGNKYVYKDFNYVEDTLNTKNRVALTDNKISTYWEYQRITASSKEENLIHDFNVDSEEAKCTISLYSKEKINELELITDRDDIKVINLKHSNNGIDYDESIIPNVSINKKLDSYNNTGYVYGSNFLSIPNSYYVKVTLQSSSYTNDVIAYEKVMFQDETFNEEEINNVIQETTIVKSAKRHVIKLDDIKAYSNNYILSSYIKSNNVIKDENVYSVGLFANVYIPNQLSTDSVEFILTVNGVDYNVIPINSDGVGTKIIRFSKGNSKTEYTELANEIIKSVILTIKISSRNNLTPYINNVKILLGGEI